MSTIIFKSFSDPYLVFQHEVDMPSCKILTHNLLCSTVIRNLVTGKSNPCVCFEPGPYKLRLILPSSHITTVNEDYCPSSSCHTQPVFSRLKSPSLLTSCSFSDDHPDLHLIFPWILSSSNGCFLKWGNQNSACYSKNRKIYIFSKMFSVVFFILFFVISNIWLPFLDIGE